MQNALQLAWLVPFFPLLGFLITGLFRRQLSKTMIAIVGNAVVFASLLVSVWIFVQVKDGNSYVAEYFNFISAGSLKIPFALQIDALSSLFLLIVTGVSFIIHFYSVFYMKEESREHYGRFFSYMNLFVFSMLLLVMGANFVIMFIGWEGVGLCSYLLIGYWFKNKEYNKAADKAFIMNRIGDLGFLIAMFWILSKTGSFDFAVVFSKASALSTTDVTIITLLLFIGATGKSAQIPLYIWLPDAMAGPTPVSALIHAATMVTAGVYMIARSNVLYSLAPLSQYIIAIVGLATAILAATVALKQNDIKKVLAYSTVSQLGYMFLGLGVGAYSAGVFHVMTHAFFKALLFLAAGSVIHAMSGEQDIRKMGGLRGKLKTTYFTFLVGCIAISGIPPFSGFFSKDAILLSTYEHNKILYVIAIFGTLLTAFYMFRLLFLTFNGNFRGTDEQHHHLHESKAGITLPLIVLAILSFVGGFADIPEIFGKGGNRLTEFLAPVIPLSHGASVSHSTEMMLMFIPAVLVLLVIVYAWYRFKNYRPSEEKGLGKILENKWYVDEFYDKIFVKPLYQLGSFLNKTFERSVVDGLVNGVGKLVNYGSRQIRLLQSGQIGSYILLMVLSMLFVFIIQFFLRK